MGETTEPSADAAFGISRWLLVVALHTLLIAPLLSLVLHLPEEPSLFEKRALAGAPVWNAWHISAWTVQAEAWLNDHFPQRARLIAWNSALRRRYMAGSDANVIVGRDGWLYFAGNGTADDILGRAPLSRADLQQWADVLSGRQAWLRERGIRYLFVVAPNKSTIYPEHLPAILRWGKRPGKLEQLVTYLREQTDVPTLDLRPTLESCKEKGPAYWPWDSHWNAYGLLAASDEVVRTIDRLGLPAGRDDAREWLSVRWVERPFDCVDLMGLRGRWPVQPVPVIRMVRPADLQDVAAPPLRLAYWRDRPPVLGVLVSERTSGRGRVAMFSDSFFRAGGMPLDALGDLPLMIQFRRFASIWDVSDFKRRFPPSSRPSIPMSSSTRQPSVFSGLRPPTTRNGTGPVALPRIEAEGTPTNRTVRPRRPGRSSRCATPAGCWDSNRMGGIVELPDKRTGIKRNCNASSSPKMRAETRALAKKARRSARRPVDRTLLQLTFNPAKPSQQGRRIPPALQTIG